MLRIDAMTGQVVAGKWRLEAPLARGGMSAVYRGRHELTQKLAAVKILDPKHFHSEAARDRFLREVTASARIDHPGIVDVFDAGTEAALGVHFVVMEFLRGEDLRARLDRGRLALGDALNFFDQALDALAAAHAAKFVHRDLKPENIFVARAADGSERVKILDFGIAGEVGGTGHTGTAERFGTPQYMAPEQMRSSKGVGPQADVWSLGVILYELLAGRPPFVGETVYALMAAVVGAEPEPLGADVPRPLAALVANCLAKEARGRPRDAGDLREHLRAALAADASTQRTERELPRVVAPTARMFAEPARTEKLVGPPTPPIAFPLPVFQQTPASAETTKAPPAFGRVASSNLLYGAIGTAALLAAGGALLAQLSESTASPPAPVAVTAPPAEPAIDVAAPVEPPEVSAAHPCVGTWRGSRSLEVMITSTEAGCGRIGWPGDIGDAVACAVEANSLSATAAGHEFELQCDADHVRLVSDWFGTETLRAAVSPTPESAAPAAADALGTAAGVPTAAAPATARGSGDGAGSSALRGGRAGGAGSSRGASGARPSAAREELPDMPSRAQVVSAMNGVAPAVSACGAGAHGTATVAVTVSGSTGRVTNLTVSGEFAGTPVGSCIARAARGATFPHFSRPTFTVNYPFRI